MSKTMKEFSKNEDEIMKTLDKLVGDTFILIVLHHPKGATVVSTLCPEHTEQILNDMVEDLRNTEPTQHTVDREFNPDNN